MLCLCREPNAPELALLRGYYARQVVHFAEDRSAAAGLRSPELAKLERAAGSRRRLGLRRPPDPEYR